MKDAVSMNREDSARLQGKQAWGGLLWAGTTRVPGTRALIPQATERRRRDPWRYRLNAAQRSQKNRTTLVTGLGVGAGWR